MFEIIFVDKEAREVNYATTRVTEIRRITATEIDYVADGITTTISFPNTENLEIRRI